MLILSSIFGSHPIIWVLACVVVLVLIIYFVPSDYKIPSFICVLTIFTLTVYFAGMNTADQKWKLKMAEAETKIATLESRAPEITTRVVTKYVDKIKYIDRVKEVPVTKFVTVENDNACKINNGFVNVYNAAIKNEVPVSSKNDSEASTVKLSDVASNQQVNMTQYHKVVAQLEALQEWIREQEKAWKELQH